MQFYASLGRLAWELDNATLRVMRAVELQQLRALGPGCAAGAASRVCTPLASAVQASVHPP